MSLARELSAEFQRIMTKAAKRDDVRPMGLIMATEAAVAEMVYGLALSSAVDSNDAPELAAQIVAVIGRRIAANHTRVTVSAVHRRRPDGTWDETPVTAAGGRA